MGTGYSYSKYFELKMHQGLFDNIEAPSSSSYVVGLNYRLLERFIAFSSALPPIRGCYEE